MFQETSLTPATLAGGRTRPSARHDGTVVPLPARPRAAVSVARRHADVADRHLAETLAAEDAAVEAGLSPFERLTCPLHHRWIHRCIASPQHVSPVTGHRWCRDCQTAITVAVDELTGKAALTCPRCNQSPHGIATRQILHACQTSLATSTGTPHQPTTRCA